MTTWRQAVWEAVQRQGARGHVITLANLEKHELDAIRMETGTKGLTPEATMRRVPGTRDIVNPSAIDRNHLDLGVDADKAALLGVQPLGLEVGQLA